MTESESNMKGYDFIIQKIYYYLIILVNANGCQKSFIIMYAVRTYLGD